MDFENIFKSRKHILKMLRVRGYDTMKYDNQNREELLILFQNRDKKISTIQDTIDILIEGPNNKIFVKYILTDKPPRSKAIEKYVENYYYEEAFLEKEDVCIFITKDKVTYKGSLENYMNGIYYKDKIFFQVMCLNSLLYDLTLNKLVPKYQILNEEETREVISRHNVDNNKCFPNVLINDPLAMFYGVKVNELVKITYPSATNGITTFYRLCITGS